MASLSPSLGAPPGSPGCSLRSCAALTKADQHASAQHFLRVLPNADVCVWGGCTRSHVPPAPNSRFCFSYYAAQRKVRRNWKAAQDSVSFFSFISENLS